MRVIVTRPAAQAGPWLDDLRARGFDAVGLPLIEIRAVSDDAPLRQAWRELARDRAAMFVSANAVDGFFAAAASPAGKGWPEGTRAWCTGPGTQSALERAGVPAACIDAPDARSARFDSEALWERVSPQVRSGDRVLIVRGGEASGEAAGRDWLAQQLACCGAQVSTVVAYLRGTPFLDDAQRDLAASDDAVWVFSSSEAIANLRACLSHFQWTRARAIATHPRIAAAAREAGFGVVRESRPGLDDVVAALESLR